MRVLVAVVCLLVVGQVQAAVGRYLSLPEASRRARVVVQGTVTATASADDAAWHRFVTRVDVRVETSWRGQPGATVALLLLGGQVGDRTQLVPGEATLRVGDRVLLFLEAIPQRGELRPVGMTQGVFRPAPDGSWRRDFDGVAVLDPGQATARQPPPEVVLPAELPALLQAHPYQPVPMPASAGPSVAP